MGTQRKDELLKLYFDSDEDLLKMDEESKDELLLMRQSKVWKFISRNILPPDGLIWPPYTVAPAGTHGSPASASEPKDPQPPKGGAAPAPSGDKGKQPPAHQLKPTPKAGAGSGSQPG
jgi:hypothetical protein